MGAQDQVACAYGGFQSIKFAKSGRFKITNLATDKSYLKSLNQRLVLIYTERTRDAKFIANKYVNNLDKKKEFMEKISSHTTKAKQIIKEKNLDEFGILLNKTWEEKKKISSHISNSEIDNLYKKAIKLGALGGKLLGAGGGFILLLCAIKKKNNFINSFKKNDVVDFKFDYKGNEIVYNSGNCK